MITFHLLKTPETRINPAFFIPTSPHTPGKYKTSDNKTPAPPTKSDGPATAYEIPPAAASYVRCVPPAESSA